MIYAVTIPVTVRVSIDAHSVEDTRGQASSITAAFVQAALYAPDHVWPSDLIGIHIAPPSRIQLIGKDSA